MAGLTAKIVPDMFILGREAAASIADTCGCLSRCPIEIVPIDKVSPERSSEDHLTVFVDQQIRESGEGDQ